jgi:hypothetical protein
VRREELRFFAAFFLVVAVAFTWAMGIVYVREELNPCTRAGMCDAWASPSERGPSRSVPLEYRMVQSTDAPQDRQL